MTAAEFTPHVGTTFAIDGIPSTLAEVEELPGGSNGERAPFSLYFRGPREPVLEQRIYALTHERMGTLEIFLVPVESTADGTLYQAVFT